jgi:hypothetical protein
LLDAEIEWHEPATSLAGGTRRGRDSSLGHDGIRQSLAVYQLVFCDGDLRIRVEDQVTEGDRVASRYVAERRFTSTAPRLRTS